MRRNQLFAATITDKNVNENLLSFRREILSKQTNFTDLRVEGPRSSKYVFLSLLTRKTRNIRQIFAMKLISF